MKIGNDFRKLIEEKYEEMVQNDLFEDFLDENTLGKIKIFINKEPKYILLSIKIKSDNVFVGSEFMKTPSV